MELFTPKYIIDTGIIIDLKHYYGEVFVTLWDKFDHLVRAGEIVSSYEVYREIEKRDDDAKVIADKYKRIFKKPTIEEQQFIKEILLAHPELIRIKKISGGHPVADPFVIAQARYYKGLLVTSEIYKPNSHSVPNVCIEYEIECLSLREFFKREGWEF